MMFPKSSIKNVRKAAIVTTLLLTLGCAKKKPQDEFVAVEKLLQQEDKAEAVTKLEKIAARSHESRLALRAGFGAARIASLELDDQKRAIKILSKEVSGDLSDPYRYQAYLFLGDILFNRLEDPKETIRFYLDGLTGEKFKPEDRDTARFRLAKAFFADLRLADAEKALKEIIATTNDAGLRENAEFESIQVGLTRAHTLNQKDLLESRQKIESFLKRFPESKFKSQAELDLGSVLELSGDVDAASEIFKRLFSNSDVGRLARIRMERINRRNQKKGG